MSGTALLSAHTGPADGAASTASAASTAAPPRAGRARAALGWLFVVVLLIGVALLSLRTVAAAPALAGVLNPDSPGPNGARALAELVRQQGVDVDVVHSRTAATAASRSGATLVLSDPVALSDDAVTDLLDGAERVVLLSASARMLALLDLGVSAAPGDASAGLVAGCALPEFAEVGQVRPERVFTPAAGVVGCFADADGDAALLVGERDGTRISFIEASRLLSNDHLADDGNAALGLALLAQGESVVWYVGSLEDGDRRTDSPATLGQLTPGWVSPAVLLLLLAGMAVIWWRGARFGPLVVESLPVTVRASETMHGRARLTARAADAPHAASAIRTGTRGRLAARVGLSPRATSAEVADAAADRIGVPRGSLHRLLDGPPPADDRELIELARRLAELETAVETAARTERTRP